MSEACKDLVEAGGEERALDVIGALDVSASWQKTYRAIDALDPVKTGIFPVYSNPDAPEAKGVSVHFNALAYFFGPFYYLGIGLPKKAATLIALSFAVFFGLEIVGASLGAHKAIGFVFQALYAVNANVDRYRKQVRGEDFWL